MDGEVADMAMRLGALGRLDISAGEDRRHDVWRDRVGQCEGDAGTRLAGRAAAHRVHDDHDGLSGLRQQRIDRLCRAQLLDAESCQLFTHGTNE